MWIGSCHCERRLLNFVTSATSAESQLLKSALSKADKEISNMDGDFQWNYEKLWKYMNLTGCPKHCYFFEFFVCCFFKFVCVHDFVHHNTARHTLIVCRGRKGGGGGGGGGVDVCVCVCERERERERIWFNYQWKFFRLGWWHWLDNIGQSMGKEQRRVMILLFIIVVLAWLLCLNHHE